MKKFLKVLAISLLICLIAFIVVWHQSVWWWIEVHTGTINEPGPYYGFFSGFGSDIAEYVIIVGVWHAIYMHWKHVNCHEVGCWRIGNHELQIDGIHYKACRKHHPGIPDKAVKGHILEAWEEKHGSNKHV